MNNIYFQTAGFLYIWGTFLWAFLTANSYKEFFKIWAEGLSYGVVWAVVYLMALKA